jgi:hypothetical protein
VYETSEILQFDVSEKRSLVLNNEDLERSVTAGAAGTGFFFQTIFFPDFAQTSSTPPVVVEVFPIFVHFFPTVLAALATEAEDCPIRAVTTRRATPRE